MTEFIRVGDMGKKSNGPNCPYLGHIYKQDIALHKSFCTGCGKQYIQRCIRVNCDEEATHKTPFGEFGEAGFCDKHWREHQGNPKAKSLFARVR